MPLATQSVSHAIRCSAAMTSVVVVFAPIHVVCRACRKSYTLSDFRRLRFLDLLRGSTIGEMRQCGKCGSSVTAPWQPEICREVRP